MTYESYHKRKVGNRVLRPETQMMGFGYDPRLSEGSLGPAATNHFEGGGFVRSNEQVAYPNLMFHFLPIEIRYDGTQPPGGHGYQVHVGPMYSDATGSVRIRTADPLTKPELRFNYLSTEQDRREWVETVEVTRNILSQPALAPFSGGEI